MIIGFGIRVGLLLVAVIVTVWALSPGPGPIPARFRVCVPTFSRIVIGAIALIVGGWLTAVTVTTKLCEKLVIPPLAVLPLSLTVTVIVAVPLVFAVGV